MIETKINLFSCLKKLELTAENVLTFISGTASKHCFRKLQGRKSA